MVRIFSHYIPFGTLLQVALDASLLFGATLLGVSLGAHGLAVGLDGIFAPALLFALLMTAIISALGLYRRDAPRVFHDVVARVLMVFLIGFPLAWGIFYVLPLCQPCRESLGLTVLLGLTGVLASRALLLRSSAGFLARRVLVLGTGAQAAEVERVFAAAAPGDMQLVGFYPLDEGDLSIDRIRVLPGAVPLAETVARHDIDEIVVAVRERRGGVLPLRQMLDCKLHGVQVTELSSFFERFRGQVRIESLHASWLIYGEGFRQGVLRNLVKRGFDLLAALALLTVAIPVMAITALAIVFESGFPVFYRQERVGQRGRIFEVIKFRSMRNDAEADGKPRWAGSDDDRITRVGRVIRRTRIDELPQIFNVLAGDMSFVGPRPERPFFVNMLCEQVPFYNTRHSVKPGITGWAQVRYKYGASVDDAIEKLQYDLYYVKNHTLFLDLVILLRTVRVVLSGEGAH
ncbi:MAG TPA: sugar transferase [Rhodocyclaceae bacterium]|nr:MAG: exopolysaccharide biosynthesis polyprenyl glycosylphosphotransferase [Betaproteobacteria bacterium CG2_30_68_42]PIV72512.1 MAG: sugar transferase [Rhodocyclales bacterium CG17_big_fil_post_rev_8_21_14_2_50_68_7]PJA58715.1 MAG: sugar transferase [Rhodocyclales bacterium CG_4_9_14_3_um_filter_68_10]HCX33719.1 sugar transferase [Rhodocyclaceae bacterium]